MLERAAAGLAVRASGEAQRVPVPASATPGPTARQSRRTPTRPSLRRRRGRGCSPVISTRWSADRRARRAAAAGALRREIADEAVRVDPVGGAEIDTTCIAAPRSSANSRAAASAGRVGRLERRARPERVPRLVVRHAREFGAIWMAWRLPPGSSARSRALRRRCSRRRFSASERELRSGAWRSAGREITNRPGRPRLDRFAKSFAVGT